MNQSTSLADALRDNFTVANLGCVGDPDSPLPADLLGAMTLIEIDAAAKQIIIAVMMRHPNLGEHLLERFREVLPATWQLQLSALVSRRWPRVREIPGRLRHAFLPLEFRLRQMLGRSQHVATQRD